LELALDEYIAKLVTIFEEVRRLLHPSGVCFIDIGDTYNAYNHNRGPAIGLNKNNHEIQPSVGRGLLESSLKAKDRCSVPFRLALALQTAAWWVRDVICWHKPAPMPESVTDRCTQSWEPILMLTKSARYFFDAEAIKEKSVVRFNGSSFTDSRDHATKHNLGNGKRTDTGFRNPRNVWSFSPEPFTDSIPGPDGKPISHFACFPSALPRRSSSPGPARAASVPSVASRGPGSSLTISRTGTINAPVAVISPVNT